MSFHGLFIGIDRYASPHINWLTYAGRDAVAFHALFTDSFGTGAVLLTDNAATRSAIEGEFNKLASCDEEDVVVIAFSGHGSPTHELVTYDADIADLSSTCIPLDLLTEWFSRIPARRLLCILDCCFSGGMGAKVLRMESTPRTLISADKLLDQLSGDGRLIITASTATEPAWENARLGHGLLTYYLLQALQGAEAVVQSGKISVYRLLEHVTQQVIAKSAQMGKPQNPTVRGSIDGDLTWPVFCPGPEYLKAFPEHALTAVTPDIQSLAPYGFPPGLLAAWAKSIPSLNQLQVDAINSYGLLRGSHLVVSAPTSSGKTMIGELAALKGALQRNRSFFLLPLRALVNDKHQQFGRTYGGFGVKTIRATGEITDDIPSLMRGQYDICLMTYEKFTVLALGSPHILDQVSTVVVDEVQMIADESRGTNLEFLLTLLRMRRREGIEPQIIALSAVIGDTNGLERWLGARLLRRNERPIPLNEGILRADGTFRFVDSDGHEQTTPAYIQRQWGKGSSQDWIIPLARKLVAEGKQVIVFRETRGEARGCALYLARALGLPPAQEALDALPTGDPSAASNDLRAAVSAGVAFHTADLDREERLVIEEQFRAPGSLLRVIAATTTLAMGVNTPAEAVIIAGLEHPGSKPYSVAEYKNIAGRAGRQGYAQEGSSFLLALSPQEEYHAWNRYVRGTPEDLISRFLAKGTDPHSLIVRVLVAAQRSAHRGLNAEDIVEFLEGSFGAFQAQQVTHNWTWDRAQLLAALSKLQGHNLIEKDEQGGYRLTPLGRLAGEGGVQIESMTRLVGALARVSPESINDQTLITAVQLTTELDDVIFPLNKKSTQKEPYAWPVELQRQGVLPSVISALARATTEQHQPTLRAKKAVACLLWMTDWPLSKIESVLTQFGGALGGAAGPIRSVTSRSCDLLPTVTRVAELIHPGLDLADRRERLLARLEVGVPASLTELATGVGTRLTRGEYHRLLKDGFSSIETIENNSDEALLACLGNGRLAKEKLAMIRQIVKAYREQQTFATSTVPVLPTYES